MRRRASLAAASLIAWAMGPACAAEIPNLYAGPRNELLPVHKLECISPDDIRNEYTPPDFMEAYAKCTTAGRYADAFEFRMFAAAYAYFDTLRVLDTSSHNAFWVLTQYYYPSNTEDVEKLRAAGEKYKDVNSPESQKFCEDLRRVGPPNYDPQYMITHGIGAYVSQSGPKVKDIDVQASWKQTVETWARCGS